VSDFPDELMILQRRQTAHAPQGLVIGDRMTLARRQCSTIIIHIWEQDYFAAILV
jgi:hypothetical protein